MMRSSQKQTLTTENTLDILSKKHQDESPFPSGYSDFTLDATLNYISQILLQEDIKDTMCHDESAICAIEKPFYDILGQKYPHTVNKSEVREGAQAYPNPIDHKFSCQPGSDKLVTRLVSEFDKGVEEGIKFLPSIDKSVLNFKSNTLSVVSAFEQDDDFVWVDVEGEEAEKNKSFMRFGSKGKKKLSVDNLDHLEGRNRKVTMRCSEETAGINAMFDKLLLELDNDMQKVNLRQSVRTEASKFSENDQEEVDDVQNLLIQCSHTVYANDHQLAEGLIKQIRDRSSLDGNGIQRMAFAFANALMARLTGTGSEARRRITSNRIPTSEYLKVAMLFITVCPHPVISFCYANRTILNVAKKASVLHIVDFGIGFGFQWPSLIKALSDGCKKHIKLRITGIDVPGPGFRPAEIVEETGQRLEDYARSFNVPFEYRGIASKWENVSLDELKIKKDEVLIVNCMHRFREVGDESVSLDSPRDRVLKLIYQMRPCIFIEGIVSITSFSPFFLRRFRQGLTLYSAIFKLLDTLIPRESQQRQFIEREFLGRDILNIIACEGSDWTIKPENYKQWHQRNLRAGLEQVPLDPVIVQECREKLNNLYENKVFFIGEDRNWLLLDWSGRLHDALSTWKPKVA